MAQNITKNAVNSDLQNSYDILLKLKNVAEIDNKMCIFIRYINDHKIQEFKSMTSSRRLREGKILGILVVQCSNRTKVL